MLRWIVLIGFFLASVEVLASRRVKNHFAVTTYYSQYSDLRLTDTPGGAKLAPSLDMEVTFRIASVFNFMFLASNFFTVKENNGQDSPDRVSYGLGLKVDLPGIFFIGGKRFGSIQGKKYPVNTYMYGATTLMTSSVGASETKSVVARYGAGIDIFLFNKISYLSLDAGIYIFEGNSFIESAAGLGFVF